MAEGKRGLNLILIGAVVVIMALVALSLLNVWKPPSPEHVEKPTETGEVLAKVSANNIVLEVRKYSSDKDFTKVSLVAYYSEKQDYCLEVKGLGGEDYEFFSYAKSVSVEEKDDKIVVLISGEKENYWNYTAEITLYKNYPGFAEVEIKVTLKGSSLRGGRGAFYATNGKGQLASTVYGGEAGWHYPLVSVTYIKYPIVVLMKDSTGKYLFSVSYCDLTGKGSIYDRKLAEYSFEMSRDAFGLKSPYLNGLKGTYIAAKYYLYVWRNEKDPLRGVLSFLDIIASKIKEKNYDLSKNKVYITNMISTLQNPPDLKDIYMIQGDLYLLKAYVGDKRKYVSESEFITQANVLLGLTYLYNKTQAPEYKNLILNILRNTSYFDVYYDKLRGIYSNNWMSAGRMDSWYQITNPSMLLAAHSLAPDLVKIDLVKMKKNANWLINFARKVKYSFPVFVYPDYTIQEPGKEADAALGYSYLMVKLYLLTGNKTYLEEASASLEHYLTVDYSKLYEAHLAPMGVAAAAHLYAITGDSKYLDYLYKLEYLCLKWINLYRGNVIEEEVPFTLVSAMPNIYSAAFEYGLFKYFLEEAYLVLKKHEKNPVAPLYRFYSISVAITSKYAFPKLLGISYRNLGYGKIDEKCWVPVEDIYPLQKAFPGQIPQEIYGFGSQIIALYCEDP
ncbi:MAG: hypothetical protein DRN04_07775 [Thermoprotei archaeon]|nr:MAG: hypothetical protein DRN04_07775 [Thermoprotei archaeon]